LVVAPDAIAVLGRTTLGTVCVALAVTSGCARSTPMKAPLVDPIHRPLVLTETRVLGLPTARSHNRFVTGWRFEEHDAGLRITPSGHRARLEFVQLADRERTLVLQSLPGATGVGSTVRVRSRGRDLGSFPIASATEITLPAGIARGVVPIELDFSEPSGIALSGAAIRSAAPVGQVELESHDIVQFGWSAVDLVRSVAAGARLVGALIPPSDARPNQRFLLQLDRGKDDRETVLDWAPDGSLEPAAVVFDVVLRETSGPVRMRFVAQGRGPAARWRGLELEQRTPPAAARNATISDPPRLVILYVLDALRADAVGHLGSISGATPCIDRLASEGAAFIDHFSVAPNTGPATKSLFTGYGYLKGRGLPPEAPTTLAEEFAAAGYGTASFSSNPHLAPSFGLTRGFEHVAFLPLGEDHLADGLRMLNDSAGRVHAAALQWLDGHRGDERVFLYLHTLNPHNPYTPPDPWPSRFVGRGDSRVDGHTGTLAAIRSLELEVSPADEERIREWYTANVAYNDAELCHFVDELRRRYEGEVLLIVTSDHGEELFDHGGVLHGYTLYDELLHVPLLMWWPERIPPTRITESTGTLDLHSSLAVLAGTTQPVDPDGGRELWGLILSGAGDRWSGGLHFATAPGLRYAAMARSSSRKLILIRHPRLEWGMGLGPGRTHEAEYVFDLGDDPEERLNRAGESSLEVDWLRTRLRTWEARWRKSQPVIDETELDAATRRQLEALGYVD
jgi:arylsulfatase A-like enzyme